MKKIFALVALVLNVSSFQAAVAETSAEAQIRNQAIYSKLDDTLKEQVNVAQLGNLDKISSRVILMFTRVLTQAELLNTYGIIASVGSKGTWASTELSLSQILMLTASSEVRYIEVDSPISRF